MENKPSKSSPSVMMEEKEGQKKSSVFIGVVIFIILILILGSIYFFLKKLQEPVVETLPTAEEEVTPTVTPPTTTPEELEIVEEISITEDEAQKMAESYVENMRQYKDNGGTNLKFMDAIEVRCSGCWDVVFTFDVKSKDDPSKMDKAEVTVHIRNGKAADSTYTQINKKAYDIMMDLLGSLEEEGGVPFSVTKPSTFQWAVPDYKGSKKITLYGKQVKSNGISLHPDQLRKYFQIKAFRSDSLNTTDGTPKLSGYKKGNLVCLVADTPRSGGRHNVEINCGELKF